MNQEFLNISIDLRNKKMADVTIDDIKSLIAAASEDLADESAEEAHVCVVMTPGGWFTEFDGDDEPYFSHINIDSGRHEQNDIVIDGRTSAEDVMKKISDYLEDCNVFAKEMGVLAEQAD